MSSLSCGIVGLPNVGKSTLFQALTKNEVDASNYPFCTIDPNVGMVEVPDARLAVLKEHSKSQKTIATAMKFVDIAGLVKGASEGEGLGNKFLANIRECDAIIQVLRCFDDGDVVHVNGKVDPLADIEVINLELILSDLQMLDNALAKVEKQARIKKDAQALAVLMKRIREHLDAEHPVRTMEFTEEEGELLKPYNFITAKRILYVANVAEDDLPEMTNAYVEQVREYAAKEGSQCLSICAQFESEVAQFDQEEAQELLDSVGLKEPGLNRLIRAAYDLLGLITFLTTGEQETRAWTIQTGTAAVDAAGKIHTDISKGFIKAEVLPYVDFVKHNGRVGAKEAGKVRLEGRDYVMHDGDVVLFHHN